MPWSPGQALAEALAGAAAARKRMSQVALMGVKEDVTYCHVVR